MRTKTLRLVLRSVTGLFLLLSLGMIVASLWQPASLPPAELAALSQNSMALTPPPVVPAKTVKLAETAIPFPELRKPLYDPPPTPPPPPEVKPALPPLDVKLLGTIIETKNSLAMVSVAGQPVEFKKVGAVLTTSPVEAKLIEISPHQIVIEREGEKITVSQAEVRP